MEIFEISKINNCKIYIGSCPKRNQSNKLDLKNLKEKSTQINPVLNKLWTH